MAPRFKTRLIGLMYAKFYGDRVTPLPVATVGLSFFLLVFDAMAGTVVFPFLHKMVKKFGSNEEDAAYYAGIILTWLHAASLCSIIWGILAGWYGKKRICLVSGYGLALGTLLFGFSVNITSSVITRIIQGCFMGNPVIVKAIVADVCDNSNIALAMSIMFTAYSIGCVIGPVIGGYLAFPSDQYPKVFSNENIFSIYGILLPSSVVAILLLISITLVMFFLPADKKGEDEEVESIRIDKETLNTAGDPKIHDQGEKEREQVGKYTTEHKFDEEIESSNCSDISMIDTMSEEDEEKATKIDSKNHASSIQKLFKTGNKSRKTKGTFEDVHYQQLVDEGNVEDSPPKKSFLEKLRTSRGYNVLKSKACIYCCFLYCFFSILDIGFYHVFSMLAAGERRYGGLGYSTSQIGQLMAVESIFIIPLQLTIVARIIEFAKPTRAIIGGNVLLAILYPLVCVIANIESYIAKWICLLWFLILRTLFNFAAIVSIVILFNNSVESNMLSFINGVSGTSASIGRMIAPIACGSMFTWSMSNVKGVKENTRPLGFPFNQYFVFFFFSLLALIIALVAFTLPDSMNYKKGTVENQDEQEN